jgi:hypothetical protein
VSAGIDPDQPAMKAQAAPILMLLPSLGALFRAIPFA